MNFEINLNYLVCLFLPVHAILYKLTVYLVPFQKFLLCFYHKPFLANGFVQLSESNKKIGEGESLGQPRVWP